VAVLEYNIYRQVHIHNKKKKKKKKKNRRINNNEQHNKAEEYSNIENVP
jgi:hypothetical protein